MRALLLLVTLASCGRIGIDPVARDGESIDSPPPIDAAPVECDVEGAACDDKNICTASSSCESGICVGSGEACVVANFGDEYSTTQGKDSWYYGYWNASLDGDGIYAASDFLEMAIFPGELWRPPDYEDTGPAFTWAYIAWWGGHPGSFPEEKLPVRRWISDVTGYANIVVKLNKADTGGGDGVRGIVFVDGVEVFRRDVAFDDTVGWTVSIPVELEVGTRVDVMMHFVGEDGSDTSDLAIEITSR